MLYDIVDQLKQHEANSQKKKHFNVAYSYRQAWQEITRTRNKAARLEWLLSVAAEHIAETGGQTPEEVVQWVEERAKKAQEAALPKPEPDAVQQELEGLRQSNDQHLMQITGLSKEIDRVKAKLENVLIERSTLVSQLNAERTKNHNFIVALNAFLEPGR
jgi:uncharacterized sporulation protein YeaH/YhbH (DUF444 family)